MPFKLIADRRLCIGAGQCLIASENVELDDESKVLVLQDGVVSESQLDVVRDAVMMCPAEALALVEVDSDARDDADRRS